MRRRRAAEPIWQRHLVIFCKEPVAGRVKSRLSATVGTVEATRFQRVVLNRLVRQLHRDPRWTTWLAVTPDTACRSRLLPSGPRRLTQGRGDLGQRMQRVFDQLPPGPAMIVGSDVPGITPDHIDNGFRALGVSDAVMGPAPDGGYWLIGLRRHPRVLRPFADVRWSTQFAMDDTKYNLKGNYISIIQLLRDVDDHVDWRLWRRGEL